MNRSVRSSREHTYTHTGIQRFRQNNGLVPANARLLFVFYQNTANTHTVACARARTHFPHNMSEKRKHSTLVMAVKIDLLHGINEMFTKVCVRVCVRAHGRRRQEHGHRRWDWDCEKWVNYGCRCSVYSYELVYSSWCDIQWCFGMLYRRRPECWFACDAKSENDDTLKWLPKTSYTCVCTRGLLVLQISNGKPSAHKIVSPSVASAICPRMYLGWEWVVRSHMSSRRLARLHNNRPMQTANTKHNLDFGVGGCAAIADTNLFCV